MRPADEPVEEGGARDELQHEEARAVVLVQTVDGADVRMIQRSENLGLALKPRHALGVLGERRPAAS